MEALDAIAELAEATNHHPDVGQWSDGVIVRLTIDTDDDEHAPAWWTLTDAEGNEVDVATWTGRD